MGYMVPALNPSYFDPVGPITPEPGTQEDLAGTLVAARFETAATYADTTLNEAIGYLNDLRGISSDISLDWIHTPIVPVEFPQGLSGLTPVDPRNPNVLPIEIRPVEFITPPPNTDGITPIPVRTIPVFNVGLPDFLNPIAPDDEVPEFTTPEPATTSPILPGKPGYILPPIPQLTPVVIPTEPTYNNITFDAVAPTFDVKAPDLIYSWNEVEYNSDLLEALKIKIMNGILNGGTGLDPAVEQAIYDRAAGRLDIELQKNENIALNDFASRGSRLPQGALIARLQENTVLDTLAREDLTRDVMIKSADLAYQYSTFIIEKGISLEHELITLANNVQQRAFEASKVVIEFAIRIFEAKVKEFQVRMEAYKVEAQIFEARIRAEIAKADLYKAIIEGRKLSLQMQELFVNLYEKQIQAISTLIDLYNTEMQGAKIESEISGLEIEKFKALVMAYAERIKAATARYDLFSAEIAGDETKAKIYGEQVKAFGEEVSAAKTQIDADVARLQGELEPIKADTQIFTALLGKYDTDIKANVSEAEILAKNEGLKINVYEGEIKEFTAVVDALTKTYVAQSEVNIANVEADLKYGEILTRIEIAKAELDKSIVEAQAKISAQLCSAALTSVSAGAQLSYRQTRADATSNRVNNTNSMTKTKTEGRTDGLKESHTYQQKCCGD